jgi:hypothetical protein
VVLLELSGELRKSPTTEIIEPQSTNGIKKQVKTERISRRLLI